MSMCSLMVTYEKQKVFRLYIKTQDIKNKFSICLKSY